MSTELDTEKAKRQAAEAARAAAESAREAAEKTAHEAAVLLASERVKREAAEKETRDAITRAAAEKASREVAEQALHEASVRAAADRSERDAAIKSARDFASAAEAERKSRELAERAAWELSQAEGSPGAARTKEAGINAANNAISPSPSSKPGSEAQAPTPPPAVSQPSAVAQPGPAAATPKPPAQILTGLIPVVIFAIAGLLFFFISSSWTTWENTSAVKTDDAYVRADVAPLSTKVSGVVRQTAVNDFQNVKAGQILVELKNDEYKARVDQAKEAIQQAEIKVADMKQRKEQQEAKVSEAGSALENSRTTVKQSEDTIAEDQASIEEAGAGIDAAKAAILQSQSAIRSAAADVTRSTLERERQEALLANESTTKEKVEQVVNESDRATANLEAQKAAHSKAQAELVARQAQLHKARQQLLTARSEREKALLSVESHKDELTLQRKQRELLDGEERTLVSDVASKKAGLIAAQADLDYTIVRAPQDGIVGELKVKPGQLVGAGTQVITVISSTPWLIANYRETQLAKVKEGDGAEISIDALPGSHLRGHVERISPASGAQFSLLPPENASGNFTKIVQRIPVKIRFDEEPQKLDALRPGMSAVATIKPGSTH